MVRRRPSRVPSKENPVIHRLPSVVPAEFDEGEPTLPGFKSPVRSSEDGAPLTDDE